MKHRAVLALAIIGAAAATLLPTAAGVLVAERQAEIRERSQIQRFGDAAISRISVVVDQAYQAVDEMNKSDELRCSTVHLSTIRRLASAYRYLHDAGVYDEHGYMCSAVLGVRTIGELPMPTPDIVKADGTELWLNAPSPLKGRRRVILGRNGYFVAMDTDSLVDTIDLSMRRFAAVSTINQTVLSSSLGVNGGEAASAVAAFLHGQNTQDRYVVKLSNDLPLAIAVTVPRLTTAESLRTLLSAWVVCGAAVGVALAFAVSHLITRRFSLENELSRAIKKGELEVHYQPIVHLVTKSWVGVEALVRWRHRGELIAPDLFIPLAESSGQIQDITDEVLKIVVLEMRSLLERNPRFYVSINVSARDLQSHRFLDGLETRLSETSIDPRQICIELTERELLDDKLSENVIRDLRAAGHPVYIDDFGTGYSSLAYLQKFAVDALKIDKTFVDTIGHRAVTSDVTPHIVSMAAALNAKIVAEGVESISQAEYLSAIGVTTAQGWLFSKALTADELVRQIETAGRCSACPPTLPATRS